MTQAGAQVDVAIIGLGPVGATLANLLGQMGLKTVALERATEISKMPRAVAFDDEAIRISPHKFAGDLGAIDRCRTRRRSEIC